ncbi:C40 family peptidase [Micromonospora sp. NBC_01813]|uniref:C40 family peptidase n=1 Tax=Micromonospora sp. NBC_01813 TaxID=2975988 RepID=UPI002DD94C11|nr:NlpC/P60 family protein [Micromonospora sp. NBC_01813]WSA07445.1 NlpC/P60 family protein [Micromonospora sp. NBC_01813]
MARVLTRLRTRNHAKLHSGYGKRPIVRVARWVLTLVIVAAGALSSAVPGHAQPTLAQIEDELDAQWRKLEPVIEQYNKVHSELKVNQKKAAELDERIRPLSLQADLAAAEIGEVANRYYRTGPSSEFNALLKSGSPTSLADQLMVLDRISSRRQQQVAAVLDTRDRYLSEKQALDALIARQQAQDEELAARRKAIDADIERLEQARAAAYQTAGYTGGSGVSGPCPAVSVGGAAGTAVRTACAQIGKPYVWGATGPSSFDCSGLTQYAWASAGVQLTHFTGSQWNQGVPVGRAEALPGDLVFFFSDLHHVGMYIGNGLMVHAPRAGQPVQIENIDHMPLVGFRRVG